MACLNLSNGLFVNSPPLAWLGPVPPVTTPAGVKITNTVSGGAPGCSIEKGAVTEFFSKPASGSVSFMTFGTPANFILVLTKVGGTNSVVLVDVTGSSIETHLIATVPAGGSTPDPKVHTSPTNGSIFLLITPHATGDVGAAIFRSDGTAGDTPFASIVPLVPSIQIVGEVTATHILIKDGGSTIGSGTRPKGICQVTPEPNVYGSLAVGLTPPATLTKQFTIKNTGTDCLSVNSIGNLAPYSVVAISKAGSPVTLPVSLEPNQQIIADVRFAPTSVGTLDRDLPLVTAPVSGDTTLQCRGTGRNPFQTISFSAAIGFGSVPVLSTQTRSLVITNTGEVNITISPFSLSTEFQCSFAGATLTPGSATPPIPITLTPTSEGAKNATLTFSSNATGSPHNISLSGSGCIANAIMVLPPMPFPSFGNVQRGFRMVRLFKLRNTGDGQLTFTARIAGTDATLFGLQASGGSITSPVSSNAYAVNPVAICGGGAVGSGEEIFGVVFYANDTPRTASAQLIIESHNATNPIGSTITYDLSAVIVPPVSIDVELVIDRSGSMTEIAGERTKIETAISAGRLFVELARPDVEDRIGIVRFNSTPEVVSSIQNITTGNQESIAATINNTNFGATGGTSIAGGALVALDDMNANPRTTMPAELKKALVVLTDANDNTPYTNPADGIAYSLSGGPYSPGGFVPPIMTTPLPTPADVKIYGIGIGREENIDEGQLSILAQATGGNFLTVQNFSGAQYFQLEKHFTQIYMDSVDLATIVDPVFVIQPGDTHTNEFDVLRGDTSAMVVIYDREGIRLPFYLESPSGEMIDVTSVPPGYQIRSGVTVTARFIELQMPAGEPERYSGRWKMIVKHDRRACAFGGRHTDSATSEPQGEFGFGFQPKRCKQYEKEIMYGFAIGVGSNFRMMPYVQPGIINTGEPIRLTADVLEFGLPVTDCRVTVTVLAPDGRTSSLILFDDGANFDNAANDGCYGNVFTETYVGGSYEFTFRAEGRSTDREPVYREAVRSKYVQGRIPIDPKDQPTGTGGKDCCRYIYYLTSIIIVLLVIIILVLLFS